uniref:RRM domain-containing protein n=1 Tax=Terrapene triunguis TaxID=2587831 RepID=A0A674J328_9SAUR
MTSDFWCPICDTLSGPAFQGAGAQCFLKTGLSLRCHKLVPQTLRHSGFHSFSFENLLTGKGLHRELYLSPEPDHVPLWKRNISNRLAEKYRQFRLNIKDTPMSAVIVRWIKRNILASYDYHSVIQELSRFGAIESVTPSGRQTAVVIFKDIISACKAMNAFPANDPGRRIQCVWHHKFMSEYRMSAQHSEK